MNKAKIFTFFILFFLLFCGFLCFAQNPTKIRSLEITDNISIIRGIPRSRVDSNNAATERKVLDKEESEKSMLRITRRDGKFFWTSRGERELVHRVYGDFDFFYPYDGSGYVRAVSINGQPYYMENVHKYMTTITFWGKLELITDLSAVDEGEHQFEEQQEKGDEAN
ncbi:MAG: hypothetical protein ABH883_07980 [Candidatus Omnitrophota bacterium]